MTRKYSEKGWSRTEYFINGFAFGVTFMGIVIVVMKNIGVIKCM